MKVAVTAASGHLGHAVIKEIIKQKGKDDLIGIARDTDKAKDLGIEIFKGDFNNKDHFTEALKNVEVLLFITGNEAPEKRVEQNRKVIEAAKEKGVRKIVHVSFFGKEGKSLYFDKIIDANRQTEKDVQKSGLEWIVGRDGLYIEPDFESLESYKKFNEITNCAGQGKSAYTSRNELARAYVNLIYKDDLNKNILNLCGKPVTQYELTGAINKVFGLELKYNPISVEEYIRDRIAVHGDFYGNIVAGIYNGIREGAYDVHSDFKKVCGRDHYDLQQMAEEFKQK